MSGKLMSADDAVKMVNTGDTLATCSIAGGITPDKLFAALGRRYARTGEPGRLTAYFPAAVGDGQNIKGLDHLAREGMLKRIIGGSYSIAGSNEKPPKIYEYIVNNRLEAYNLPMGVMMQLLREIAAKRPGVVTTVGLGTFVDPRQDGGRMNAAAPPDLVELIELAGREYLFFKTFPINVAFIRGTTADENGNLTMEHEYSLSTVLPLAMAARNSGGKVIAQVKRLAARGVLNPQMVRVPGVLVDAVVLDPDQLVTTGLAYDPASCGEMKLSMDLLQPDPLPDIRRALLRRVIQQLRRGQLVNLGYGITAYVPSVVLEEGLQNELTFTTEHGCYGGHPYTALQFGGAYNADALIESTSQFDFIDGGGPDAVCLSFAELDRAGNVNVTKLKDMPHVVTGAGGFIDLVTNSRKIVFCGTVTAGGLKIDVSDGKLRVLKEGRFRKIVPQVQQVSFNGPRAVEKGQEVVYVTDRGVFQLDRDGLLLTEIAPGLDAARDLQPVIDFELRISPDLKAMDAALFRPGKMGIQLEEG